MSRKDVNFTHCRSCGHIWPECELEDLECPDCRAGKEKTKRTMNKATKGAASVGRRDGIKEKTQLHWQAGQLTLGF